MRVIVILARVVIGLAMGLALVLVIAYIVLVDEASRRRWRIMRWL